MFCFSLFLTNLLLLWFWHNQTPPLFIFIRIPHMRVLFIFTGPIRPSVCSNVVFHTVIIQTGQCSLLLRPSPSIKPSSVRDSWSHWLKSAFIASTTNPKSISYKIAGWRKCCWSPLQCGIIDTVYDTWNYFHVHQINCLQMYSISQPMDQYADTIRWNSVLFSLLPRRSWHHLQPVFRTLGYLVIA